MALTKQEIMRWYNTSVLPTDGTAELNAFLKAINRSFSAFIVIDERVYSVYDRNQNSPFNGVYYDDRNKAHKAFQKYGFTDDEIMKKMGMPPPLKCKATKARFRLRKLINQSDKEN